MYKKYGHAHGHGHGFPTLSGAILGLDVCIRKPLDTWLLASAFGGRGRNQKREGRQRTYGHVMPIPIWSYDDYICIIYIYIHVICAYICHFMAI